MPPINQDLNILFSCTLCKDYLLPGLVQIKIVPAGIQIKPRLERCAACHPNDCPALAGAAEKRR